MELETVCIWAEQEALALVSVALEVVEVPLVGLVRMGMRAILQLQ